MFPLLLPLLLFPNVNRRIIENTTNCIPAKTFKNAPSTPPITFFAIVKIPGPPFVTAFESSSKRSNIRRISPAPPSIPKSSAAFFKNASRAGPSLIWSTAVFSCESLDLQEALRGSGLSSLSSGVHFVDRAWQVSGLRIRRRRRTPSRTERMGTFLFSALCQQFSLLREESTGEGSGTKL